MFVQPRLLAGVLLLALLAAGCSGDRDAAIANLREQEKRQWERIDSLEAEVRAMREALALQEGVAPVAAAPPSSESAEEASAPPVIQAGLFGAALDKSVGFLVTGVEVRLRTGEHKDIAVGEGSAFVVSKDGLVMTNFHVVEPFLDMKRESSALSVAISRRLGVPVVVTPGMLLYLNAAAYPVELISTDPTNDLALLRLRPRAGQEADWRALELAPSTRGADDRGTMVYACGFPGESRKAASDAQLEEWTFRQVQRDISDQYRQEDFMFSLTRGIISRIFTDKAKTRFIQHDAVLAPGSSGGPLLDSRGRILGINTRSSDTADGFSIAVEVEQIRSFLKPHLKTAP